METQDVIINDKFLTVLKLITEDLSRFVLWFPRRLLFRALTRSADMKET